MHANEHPIFNCLLCLQGEQNYTKHLVVWKWGWD